MWPVLQVKFFFENTTTTLGNTNLWPLLTGGRCSEVDLCYLDLNLGLKYDSRCRQVVVIWRWSLAQV